MRVKAVSTCKCRPLLSVLQAGVPWVFNVNAVAQIHDSKIEIIRGEKDINEEITTMLISDFTLKS